ncbi:MAG: helix-turn-helix domain-containing protein [Fibrobacteres bacterium]|nr:helix-turn-helix domain-containing protein [Fibrobacterota bacterium]
MSEKKIDYSRDDSSRILEKETLGSFLRKTRIGNGVDLARMSQKTKIHVDLITAIEHDDYNRLPGTTYNKLFIKSIAKYLELNPDEIYKRYLQEHPEHAVLDLPTNTAMPKYVEEKVKSDTKTDLVEAKPRNYIKAFIPIILLLAAGALLLFLMPTEKDIPAPEVIASTVDTPTVSVVETQDSLHSPLNDDSLEAVSDSLTTDTSKTAAVAVDSVAVKTDSAAADTVEPVIPLPNVTKRYLDETKGTIFADFICTKGNISISAYRNGALWTNYFSVGHAKKFASKSTMYIRLLGEGEGVVVHNGKQVPVKPEKNKFVLKIEKDTTSWVTINVWNGVVKKP